jgi:hypothetical protein
MTPLAWTSLGFLPFLETKNCPLSVSGFACDLLEATHRRPPWLKWRYHPRYIDSRGRRRSYSPGHYTATVRARPGRLSGLSVLHSETVWCGDLYERAARLTVQNGGL